MNDFAIMLLAAALGGFIQSASGFGSALVAMPLLMHAMDPREASPTMALLSLLVSSFVLWRNRQSLDFARARGLILASVPGIPIGIFLLKTLPARWIHIALGSMLVAFSLWSLFFQKKHSSIEPASSDVAPIDLAAKRRGKLAIWITGFSSGLLGGAYNTSGPPLVIYGSLQRLPPAEFKSVLSAYFICEGSILIVFQFATGLMTSAVAGNVLRLAPVMLLGIAGGFFVERVIPREHFARMVLVLLALLGIKLINF